MRILIIMFILYQKELFGKGELWEYNYLINEIQMIKLNFKKVNASSVLIVGFLGLIWLSIILALAGLFYSYFFIAYLALVIILAGISLKNIPLPFKFSKEAALTVAIALIVTTIFSAYSFPTVFSGRDQGTLSESAIRLAQEHRLTFSSFASQEFFQIYGPGAALNFPGFHYQEDGSLITKFPLGYIAWLAVFYSIFGLSGFIVANALTLLIFLWFFYLLSGQVLRRVSPVWSVVLALTAFPIAWFFKFTLSENLGWALTWMGVYALWVFLQKKDVKFFTLALLSLGLLLFVRIEALGMLATSFLIVYFYDRKLFRKVFNKFNISMGLALLVTYLISFFGGGKFYQVLGKNLLKFFSYSNNQTEKSFTASGESWYTLEVFFIYALGGFLVLGLIGIAYLAKKKSLSDLIPFLILSPVFFYFLDPNISDDHPWMLRRFAFAVIPGLIFYTVLLIDKFISLRLLRCFSLIVLVGTSLIVTFSYVTFIPYRGLLSEIETLSTHFEKDDLILVDRLATGDPWAMMSGPLSFLFNKQAVYFFNPADLEKIDTQNFSRVYLIISDDNVDFYAKHGVLGNLIPQKDYALSYRGLENTSFDRQALSPLSLELPHQEDRIVHGKIYLWKK